MQYIITLKLMSLDFARVEGVSTLFEHEAIKNAIIRVPVEQWSKSEEELRLQVRPTHVDYSIRFALWNEIRFAEANHSKIESRRIWSGICTYQNFFQNVLQNPPKLAWVFQPVQEYKEVLKPLLICSASRLFELVNLDIRREDGSISPQLARVVLEASKAVEARVMGAPTSTVCSVSIPVPAPPKMSLEEIDEKICLLERKIYNSKGNV